MQATAVQDSPIYAEAHQLDGRVRRLSRRRRRDKAEMANALLLIKERKHYALLGYASMTAYGATVEGLGASTTCELLKIAAGCRERPRIRAAFEAGELPADKARVIVAASTPADEGAWLERAKELDAVGLRALHRGEEPGVRKGMRWSRGEWGWVEVAVQGVRESGGPTGLAEALAEVCRRFVMGEALGANKAPGSKLGAQPLLVLGKDKDGALTLETSAGPVELDREAAAWAGQVGEVVDLSDGPPPAPAAGSSGAPPKRAIPTAVRRYVSGRDGGRCQVPGCGRRAWVEADHLRGWKEGHDPEQIVLLCSQHHRQRTRGFLRVTVDEGGARRFFLHDGTDLGQAGDPERADLPERFVDTKSAGAEPEVAPVAERFVDTKSAGADVVAPVAERFVDTKSAGAGREVAPAAEGFVDTKSAGEDAVQALIAMEVSPKRARACLRRAVRERPGLAQAEAGELVRASLAYC